MKSKLLRVLDALLGIGALTAAAMLIRETVVLYKSGEPVYTYAKINTAFSRIKLPLYIFAAFAVVMLLVHAVFPQKTQYVRCVITPSKATRSGLLWKVRLFILIFALAFIGLGLLNGGLNDVFVKAINICTECIGLG